MPQLTQNSPVASARRAAMARATMTKDRMLNAPCCSSATNTASGPICPNMGENTKNAAITSMTTRYAAAMPSVKKRRHRSTNAAATSPAAINDACPRLSKYCLVADRAIARAAPSANAFAKLTSSPHKPSPLAMRSMCFTCSGTATAARTAPSSSRQARPAAAAFPFAHCVSHSPLIVIGTAAATTGSTAHAANRSSAHPTPCRAPKSARARASTPARCLIKAAATGLPPRYSIPSTRHLPARSR